MEGKIMNVYEKLMTVQTKLRAPKGQYNSFGKYSYRSCEDILEALKPLLAEVGAIVNISDEIKGFEQERLTNNIMDYYRYHELYRLLYKLQAKLRKEGLL